MSNNRPPAGGWPRLRVAQWATILILVAFSELVAWSGHKGVSYAVDAVAVVAYLGFRQLRRLPASR